MPTDLQVEDVYGVVGMRTDISKAAMPKDKVRLAQNVHFREAGALTKRNGYTKINNSPPQN